MKKIILEGFILIYLVILILLLLGFDIMTSNLYFPYSAMGKCTIIYGSDNLQPKIQKYSVSWIEQIHSDNRKSIKVGDIVTYEAYIDGQAVTICNNVETVGEGYITLQRSSESNTNKAVRITDVDGRVYSTWNFMTPFIYFLLRFGQTGFLIVAAFFPIGLIVAILKWRHRRKMKKLMAIIRD